MTDEEIAALQQPAQSERRKRSSSAPAIRAHRELAWHLEAPLLETTSPPRKRCPQEEYRRPAIEIESALVELDVTDIATELPTVISEATLPLEDVPIPMRPLPERLIGNIDDAVWGMSKLIIADPRRLEDPEIAERAKAEMMRYNSKLASNGRTSGQLENGVSLTELFASLGAAGHRDTAHLASHRSPPTPDSSNPVNLDWKASIESGAFGRIRHLIQSNYSATSRPSLMTAVRHWARFCARHGLSVFRPQVANDWEAKVVEEMILMLFLDYLLFEVKVQGSTCESYFSLFKGWHGEMMGYQPASSGLFTTVWISKLLRGARRNFPSRFAEREAHSVIWFQKFRRQFAHWFFIKEFFVPHDEMTSEGIAMIRTFLASIDWFDFLAEVVLEAMVVCLMRIGEALPTKLLPKKLNRDDIRFIYKDGKLFETVVRIYPLKQSVRARKAGKKIPIVIPANAGPYLMAAELLWLMVAADPTVGNPTVMPMFRKASKLSVSKSRNHPRGDGQVTHDWLLKQYRRKLSENGMDPAKVTLFKLHSPRIIGATTLFASGKSDMHLKSKGRWAGDIAFIYARFCPEMDRDAVRAMGQTDASPFMECADSHWASLSGWTEDSADLGDDAEFDDGDEALSDDEDD